MSVFDNMAYGLKIAGKPRTGDRRERVAGACKKLLELLPTCSARKPAPALLGGQRQRVAMGRAIVRDPAAFPLYRRAAFQSRRQAARTDAPRDQSNCSAACAPRALYVIA